MDCPLDDIRLTIRHAKDHIAELDSLTKAFFDTNPYEMVVEPDPLYRDGRKIQYAQITQPLPYRIPGLAADVIKGSLRPALDHAGFAVACAVGSSGKHAHFPFGDTPGDVEARRKDRSKDIPKEIFDFMAACKPYKGGNDTLWRLNKLANTNKHEITVAAVLFASQISYRGTGFHLLTGPRNSSDRKIMIRWIRPDETDLNQEIQLTGTIKFDDIGKLTFNQPAISLLNDCVRIVERVISGVEAEGIRLNIF